MKNITKTEKLQKNLLVDKNRIKDSTAYLENKDKIVEKDVLTSENNILLKNQDKNLTKNFKHFNVLRSINERSFISEVTIPIFINNIKFLALCDSGSESSIIGLNYINKYLPNWRTFEDGINKPEYGIGVDGSTFSILGAKLFTKKNRKTSS